MSAPITEESAPIYGHHEADYEKYGEQFALHMDRMTAEQLDDKVEIAWELAYRDAQIAELKASLTAGALRIAELERWYMQAGDRIQELERRYEPNRDRWQPPDNAATAPGARV